MVFPQEIASLFLSDRADQSAESLAVNAYVLEHIPPLAMRLVFGATPIIALQLIGAAYFQAIGKAIPAFLLTLTRQGFFFIPPLILSLPFFLDELGVWLSFFAADVLSTIVTGLYLRKEIKNTLQLQQPS